MHFYIPIINFPIYGIIVLSSIFIGIAYASIMMVRSGAGKQSVLYTSMLSFVSIITCSLTLSITLYQDPEQIGFIAAGGAAGLLIGVLLSVFINQDHEKDTIVAWVLSAPLMYGLSKIGCHFAGCCYGIPYDGMFSVTYELHGHRSFFPIQITEAFVFVIIFLIGIILVRISDKKMRTARVVIVLSAIAKIGLDFLRATHIGGEIISINQIMIAILTVAALVLSFLWG